MVAGDAEQTPVRARDERGTILRRGLRARARIHAATAVAAVVTIAAAVLGPVFAQAASESTLRDALVQATSSDAGLHISTPPSNGANGTLGDFEQLEASAPRPGTMLGYPTAWGVESYAGNVTVAGAASPQPTSLVWRADLCSHVVLTAGRCADRAGQAMVSDRTVTSGGPGWKLGAIVQTAAGPVHVVGVYRADPRDAYWFGVDYFTAGVDSEGLLDIDALFVSRSEMDRLPPDAPIVAAIDYPLQPARIRLADVPRLRAAVVRLEAAQAAGGLTVSTQIGRVLDAAAKQQQLVAVGTLLVTVQLTLLGWLVLFLILIDVAEARGPEIALAKLRGQGRWAVIRFALAEPLLILGGALPAGLVLGYLAAAGFSAAVLVPGTPVAFPLVALAVACSVSAGSIASAVVTAARVLRRPVVEQWRRTSAARSSRLVILVEWLVAVGAIIEVVRLRTAASPGAADSLDLIAPGLLVLAVALVGVRLMPAIVRLTLPFSRASLHVSTFLATRQVARRPSAIRLATLLTVAVGLAAFAVGGVAVASINRTARADGEVGASSVVSVGYNGRVDPVRAVDAADPDGRWAMAAATWLPDGGDTVVGTVLGVDPSRLSAVGAAVAGGPTLPVLAAEISGHTVPPVKVSARQISAVIRAQDLHGLVPTVQFDLESATGMPVSGAAQLLRAGTHEYTAAIPCAAGCTFDGLSWQRPVGTLEALSGTATVQRITSGSGPGARDLGVRLGQPAAWRAATPVSESSDRVSVSAGAVTDRFASSSGSGGIAYAFVPAVLPMVTSPGGLLNSGAQSGLQVIDQSGATAAVRVASETPVLPVVLDQGVAVDVTYLDEVLPNFVYEASWQVWLSPTAPADALARLKRAGLDVGSVQSVAARRAEFARQGPALSFLLLLASAIVGAVLAALGTAVAITAAGRRRSYELAAARMLGVEWRSLRRAAAAEQGILLGAAALLGIPSGLLAALITLPILPEFADRTPIALRFVPPLEPMLLFTLAFVALLSITVVVASSAVVRTAVPSRLREADE